MTKRVLQLLGAVLVVWFLWCVTFPYTIDGHIDAGQLSGDLWDGGVIEVPGLCFVAVPWVSGEGE